MTYTGSRRWNFAKSLRSMSICSSIDNRLLDRLCEEWISPSIDRSTSRWMMIGNGHKFVKTGFWEIGKAIDSWTINQTIDAIRYFECLDHHWPFFDYCRPFYHSLSTSPHWNDPLLKKSRRNLSSFIGVFKILKIEGCHHLARFRLRQSPPPSMDDHRAFIFICNIDNHRHRLFPDAKDQFSPSAFSHLFFSLFSKWISNLGVHFQVEIWILFLKTRSLWRRLCRISTCFDKTFKRDYFNKDGYQMLFVMQLYGVYMAYEDLAHLS